MCLRCRISDYLPERIILYHVCAKPLFQWSVESYDDCDLQVTLPQLDKMTDPPYSPKVLALVLEVSWRSFALRSVLEQGYKRLLKLNSIGSKKLIR